jgi:hypothetical protein
MTFRSKRLHASSLSHYRQSFHPAPCQIPRVSMRISGLTRLERHVLDSRSSSQTASGSHLRRANENNMAASHRSFLFRASVPRSCCWYHSLDFGESSLFGDLQRFYSSISPSQHVTRAARTSYVQRGVLVRGGQMAGHVSMELKLLALVGFP